MLCGDMRGFFSSRGLFKAGSGCGPLQRTFRETAWISSGSYGTGIKSRCVEIGDNMRMIRGRRVVHVFGCAWDMLSTA